ncbi:MAG: NAD(P)H-hydrate dehydratase [Bacteroidales bacterium]|nr:NAD(P)H-hydrate dehydratase [Bacteroidales bacterium]
MKIFTSSQIALIDSFTIINEPVSETALIKRAARKLYEWLKTEVNKKQEIFVFAGPGNNGNDAIALTSILAARDFNCKLFLIKNRTLKSESRKELLGEAYLFGSVLVKEIEKEGDIPEIPSDAIVVEGIFGIGLNRCAEGIYCPIIEKINNSGARVISIDLPSGLLSEENVSPEKNSIIWANNTLTFEFPKLCMFFKEASPYIGKWDVLPIGLHSEIIEKTDTNFFMLTEELIRKELKPRDKFSHKGNFGHSLLIAGSYGMGGAAVLAAKGAMRSGAGLLTVHIPKLLYQILQISVPEAICSVDWSESIFTGVENTEDYSAIAVGPGIGKSPESADGLRKLLKASKKPMVIDADALNIIASERDLIDLIPEGSVITPHPGEFARIAGETKNSYDAVMKQSEFSKKHNIVVVLKGAHTSVATPDGEIFFNSTGNPGMATAGSGDVLTGTILALISQGYSSKVAAIAGVFIHGLAGDIALETKGENSIIAGDIAASLGAAFKRIGN